MGMGKNKQQSYECEVSFLTSFYSTFHNRISFIIFMTQKGFRASKKKKKRNSCTYSRVGLKSKLLSQSHWLDLEVICKFSLL